MFKVIGGVLIVVSTYMLFNKTVFASYYTYKFLKKVVSIIQKLEYEKSTNMIYENIFAKINFDWERYVDNCSKNNYIEKSEISYVKEFFENLGKRDAEAEDKYINYNFEKITAKRDIYYKQYCEGKKVYALCGISFGLFIIIFLI